MGRGALIAGPMLAALSLGLAWAGPSGRMLAGGPTPKTGSAPTVAASEASGAAAPGARAVPAASASPKAGSGSVASPPRAAAGSVSVRVFTIKFRDPSEVTPLIARLLSDKGSVTTGPPKQRTVMVQDRPEILDRVGELIASYDVPPRNVGFTITLIMASSNAEAGQPISREVRGITEALPDITKWTNYKTLDSVTIVGSEGSRTARDLADSYRVEFNLESVSDSRGGAIRLNPFSLQKVGKGPGGEPVYTPVYTTTIKLTNDKMLTIGATKSETSPKAVFLAIKAHIEVP